MQRKNSTVSVNVSGGLAFSAGAGGAFTQGRPGGGRQRLLAGHGQRGRRADPWAGMTPSTTYSGVLSGSGSLDKVGSGQLALTNRSSFSGGTTVNGGTLQLNVGGNTGTLAAVHRSRSIPAACCESNTTDALGYYNGSASAVNLNGGTLSIFVGGHANLAGLNMTGGVLTSTGSGDVPAITFSTRMSPPTPVPPRRSSMPIPSSIRGPGNAGANGQVTFSVAVGF